MSTLSSSRPGEWELAPRSGRRGSGFWQLLRILRPYYWLMGITVLTGIMNHGFMIAAAGIGALMVGRVATGAAAEALRFSAVVLGGVVAGRAVAAWAEMWLAHDLAYRILAELRTWLYQALDRLAPGYLLERRSGDLSTAAMADVDTVEWFYAHTVGTFIVAVVVPLGALLTLASMHWLLPLALLPATLAVATVPFWLRKRAAAQGRRLRETLGSLNAEVVDGVQGLREIVAFGQGQRFLEGLRRSSRSLVGAQVAHGRRAGGEQAVTSVLITLGMVSIVVAAAYLVSSGSLSPALYPVVIILAIFIFRPVTDITGIAENLGVVFAAADRVFAVLNAPAPVPDTEAAPPPGPVEPRIEFREVSFRYATDLPPALDAASFSVAPGESVALVGHSGAGKSTCIHLLMRFWDVTDGAITIGGHDVRAFPQSALRALIAWVPQDIYLFNMTIRENIRLARPDAPDEEVEEAARVALAHDFILRMPQGYETNAGERGVRMSGGQRQRIAIARAVLKDAPILVTDEAVSNLDAENERLLREAMARVRAGRTSLVIAHRLSTIRSADRIVVLEKGRTVEAGPHDSLLAAGGVYADLVAFQQRAIPL